MVLMCKILTGFCTIALAGAAYSLDSNLTCPDIESFKQNRKIVLIDFTKYSYIGTIYNKSPNQPWMLITGMHITSSKKAAKEEIKALLTELHSPGVPIQLHGKGKDDPSALFCSYATEHPEFFVTAYVSDYMIKNKDLVLTILNLNS